MKSVHILAERPHWLRHSPGYWLPVYLNRFRLRELGLKIKFYYEAVPGLEACDVLLLSSWRLCWGNTVGHDPASRARLLEQLAGWRERVRAVAWFDLADSSGTPQFEVLPHVTRYFKKQLLKDLFLYRQSLYAGRIYADFLHCQYGLEEPKGPILADDPDFFYDPDQGTQYQTVPAPLPVDEEKKLGVSWNLGLHDFRGGDRWSKVRNQVSDRLESFLRGPHRLPFLRHWEQARDIDVAGFFQLRSRPLGSFHRQRALEILGRMKNLRVDCAGFSGRERIPYLDYVRLLGRAKIGLSLFGLGEVCYREFEIFNAGAALVMQDMSHLRTWPDVYQAGQTYQPVRWDLADLEEVIGSLLGDEKRRLALAQNGQETYLKSWSVEGKEKFCQRFKEMVESSIAS